MKTLRSLSRRLPCACFLFSVSLSFLSPSPILYEHTVSLSLSLIYMCFRLYKHVILQCGDITVTVGPVKESMKDRQRERDWKKENRRSSSATAAPRPLSAESHKNLTGTQLSDHVGEPQITSFYILQHSCFSAGGGLCFPRIPARG